MQLSHYVHLSSCKFYLIVLSEVAVQLEALVGDVEDAALFVMAGNMFSSKLSISSVSHVNLIPSFS